MTRLLRESRHGDEMVGVDDVISEVRRLDDDDLMTLWDEVMAQGDQTSDEYIHPMSDFDSEFEDASDEGVAEFIDNSHGYFDRDDDYWWYGRNRVGNGIAVFSSPDIRTCDIFDFENLAVSILDTEPIETVADVKAFIRSVV